MASKYSCLTQTPCAKTREFGEAEFSDCLPVSASVCVFAFDTGGLGLWLGAFEKSGLYRCQSVPGPPMPCFAAQSFGLCNSARCLRSLCSVDMTAFAVFATLICQINIVFPCKDTKAAKSCAFCVIRIVPNSWDCYAGFLWHRALPSLQL